MLALRDVLERRANVVRDALEHEVGVEAVVPGDLVVLREGERVPADARVVSAAGLAVDESALTGESVPVDKLVEPVPQERTARRAILDGLRRLCRHARPRTRSRHRHRSSVGARPHRRPDSAGRAAAHAAPAPRARAFATDGRPRDRGHTHPRRSHAGSGIDARGGLSRRGLGSRRSGARGTRRDRHHRVGARRARDGRARSHRAPADRSRDSGQRDGDRLRQDGDAHREPAARRRAAAGFGYERRTAFSSRRFSRRAPTPSREASSGTRATRSTVRSFSPHESGGSRPKRSRRADDSSVSFPSTRFESA